MLNQAGVIYRATESGPDGSVKKVLEYDALHFANAKCGVENHGEKAWYSDSQYYEKSLLCLSHAYKQHYQSWTPKKFAEQAWEDLCYARKRVFGNDNVSYSDLLLFFHPEMVEPSYIVLCALE